MKVAKAVCRRCRTKTSRESKLSQNSTKFLRRDQDSALGKIADQGAIFSEIAPKSPLIDRADRARVWDTSDNCYVDYLMGMGCLLFGHSPGEILDAVKGQLHRGIGYGKSHNLHAEVSEGICRTVPSAETCVLSNTGTEAVQVALRIARAHTGRRRIIKFAGHYHGWCDPILTGIPSLATEGQDPGISESVTVCEWNDLESLKSAMADDVAAVIMEPITANGGCLWPDLGYLDSVRNLVTRNGAVLIFDETVTGYRIGLGGAQEYFGVTPDITVLGKALGGGFPISAVCGRAALFEKIWSRKVVHMGTYNANVVSTVAAITVIRMLERDRDFHRRLDERTKELASVIKKRAAGEGISLTVNAMAGFLYVFISDTSVSKFADVSELRPNYREFSAPMLTHGVHAPSIGAMYVTLEHDEDDLERTGQAVRAAAQKITK